MLAGAARISDVSHNIAACPSGTTSSESKHLTGGAQIVLRLSVLAWLVLPALGQAPQITSAGVVNAASYAQPIAPGSIVAIFGSYLAPAPAGAVQTPLPPELGGTSVTVDGLQAPLFYVSPGQINFQVPSSITVSSRLSLTVAVVVTTAAGASASVQVPVGPTSQAVFTTDGSGCGQAVALNIAADGSYSVNSPLNSAAPRDYIALFGSGLGIASGQPPDGTPPSGAAMVPGGGGGVIDGEPWVAQYAGLAPGLVGVDQINFQIPQDTRNGCAVPVAIDGNSLISPTVTLSVNSTRGQCVDPLTQSYGNISLTRTQATGTGQDGETDTFSAVFLSGRGIAGQHD
jgi:uncharacterized protein (TIGR03437 family)